MVNKRYRKGYLFEIRVKKYLERLGYKVFRAAGSKPLDLIALSDKEIYLIECKARPIKKISKKTGEKLRDIAEGTCGEPIIAFKDDKNRIHFYDPMKETEINIPYVKGIGRYIDR
jgi:Holliday junction resolvase